MWRWGRGGGGIIGSAVSQVDVSRCFFFRAGIYKDGSRLFVSLNTVDLNAHCMYNLQQCSGGAATVGPSPDFYFETFPIRLIIIHD